MFSVKWKKNMLPPAWQTCSHISEENSLQIHRIELKLDFIHMIIVNSKTWFFVNIPLNLDGLGSESSSGSDDSSASSTVRKEDKDEREEDGEEEKKPRIGEVGFLKSRNPCISKNKAMHVNNKKNLRVKNRIRIVLHLISSLKLDLSRTEKF